MATFAFGSRMARVSAVEAEHFLALLSVKASACAFESFENATAFGSMNVHFAVRAAVFLIVSVCAVSDEIFSCTASFMSSSSAPVMISAVTVES